MSTLLDKVKALDSFEVFTFWDKDNDGGCPCFEGKRTENGKTVHVWGCCWRVSENAQDLHVWGDHPDLKKIARATKKALDATEWYNPYTIIYGDPK